MSSCPDLHAADGRQKPPAVTIVVGNDDTLRRRAFTRTVAGLTGDGSGGETVEQLPMQPETFAVCHTPPMFSDRRVVTIRTSGKADDDTVTALLSYLDAPADATFVVVEWDGTLPKKLRAAMSQSGELIDAGAPRTQRGRTEVLTARLAESPLEFSRDAVSSIAATLGEDIARIDGIVDVLDRIHPAGTRVDAATVAPYLGEGGSVPPWDLTDAIDAGDTGGALRALARILDAGGRHPLQVLASLTTHTRQTLHVTFAGLTDEKTVAAQLGMKGSTFPARKALARARRLGPDRAATAMRMVAQTRTALTGGSGLDGRLVLELLVARLCHLSRRS